MNRQSSLDRVEFQTDAEDVLRVELPGEPVPKGRPRHGNGNTYTPRRTKQAEDTVGWTLRSLWRGPADADSLFMLTLWFHVSAIKADIDNLLKLVMDSGNGIVWADDRQVREVHVCMRKDAVPGVELIVSRLAS